MNVSLHQGTPEQVARMVLDEVAEIGIATESLADYDDLVTLPCYEWQHVLVLPAGASAGRRSSASTLEDLAAEPLITYHPSFTGRTRIDDAFAQRKLKPHIVLEAIDSDVIKTYVRLGLGIGIVAEMAVRDDPQRRRPGGRGPLGHLFGQNVARVAFKRGAYLRNFVYAFAELLSDRLDRTLIAEAMAGDAQRLRTVSTHRSHDDRTPRTPPSQAACPQVGTTIFTVMSALAAEHGAVNLGQGFPDFDCDPKLLDAVDRGDARRPQPVPADGRRAGAARSGRRQDRGAVRPPLRPGTEITVTAGATQAILTAILALVHPGDEVIVLEPCYDSYVPNIELAGGTRGARAAHAGHLPARLRHASPRRSRRAPAPSSSTRRTTRAPRSGRADDMQQLAATCWRPTDVLADQRRGLRAHGVRRRARTRARRASRAWRRAASSSRSFGKTYHVTGWKVGYVAAPAALTAEFRKVHQFNVFTVNTPMQHGAGRATWPTRRPTWSCRPSTSASATCSAPGWRRRGSSCCPARARYFQCVDYLAPSATCGEADFCHWLTSEIGVAAIPLSAFYGDGFDQRVVRFCFAKKDETLQHRAGAAGAALTLTRDGRRAS